MDERDRGHIVVIGASWGGLHAISTILERLPADFAAAIAVVQHRAKESDGLLASLLQDVTPLVVVDVEDKEPIRAGHVYVAPPDYHLLVDDGYFSLSTDAAVRYSRPSIDVTLESAADRYAERVVGVVLTGANDDGARGLQRVVERGGYAVVQDPGTAEVRTMPEAALRAVRSATPPRPVGPPGGPGARWHMVPLDGIADHLAARLATVTAGMARHGEVAS